jgi:hypothetical protein
LLSNRPPVAQRDTAFAVDAMLKDHNAGAPAGSAGPLRNTGGTVQRPAALRIAHGLRSSDPTDAIDPSEPLMARERTAFVAEKLRRLGPRW